MHNLNHILESLLFVAEEPLSVDRLKNILGTVESREIRAALHTLAEQYDLRGGGFGLYEVAGGWQLRSRPQYNQWIKRMLQPAPQRLTKATLETLAIVAYNQPIIRADIEHIRGVDCGGVLRQLLERKLIRVLGRKEIPGRPLIYATTKLFLELFDLKNLKDLPGPKEIEALTAAQANNAETPGAAGSQEMLADTLAADSVLTGRPEEPMPAARTAPKSRFPGPGALHRTWPPCQASAGSRLQPHLGASPARIAGGSPKISTHPTRICGVKAGPTSPVSPLIGDAHVSRRKED